MSQLKKQYLSIYLSICLSLCQPFYPHRFQSTKLFYLLLLLLLLFTTVCVYPSVYLLVSLSVRTACLCLFSLVYCMALSTPLVLVSIPIFWENSLLCLAHASCHYPAASGTDMSVGLDTHSPNSLNSQTADAVRLINCGCPCQMLHGMRSIELASR